MKREEKDELDNLAAVRLLSTCTYLAQKIFFACFNTLVLEVTTQTLTDGPTKHAREAGVLDVGCGG